MLDLLVGTSLAAIVGSAMSAAAGLNAFIPLLTVGLIARFTSVLVLPASMEWLESWPAIIISGVLLLAELVFDKVPGVDHMNDVLQTAVRPLVGSVIFAATSAAESIESSSFWQENQWLGFALGLVIALTVHGTKTTARGFLNAGSAGTAAPVASVAEDGAAITLSLSALFIPAIAAIMLFLMALVIVRVVQVDVRRRRKRAAKAAAEAAAEAPEAEPA